MGKCYSEQAGLNLNLTFTLNIYRFQNQAACQSLPQGLTYASVLYTAIVLV